MSVNRKLQRNEQAMKKHSKDTKNSAPPPRLFKVRILKSIWNWLCWITNNEFHPKNEVAFDILFFIINTICLAVGIAFFIIKDEPQWIGVLVIEYTWALDNMRNNREYIK
jgi:hypothetical protein